MLVYYLLMPHEKKDPTPHSGLGLMLIAAENRFS